MRKKMISLVIILLCMVQQSYSQQKLTISEDFDGSSIKFTVPKGTWVYNSDYFRPSLSGATVSKSYLGFVPDKIGDTSILQLASTYDFSQYECVQLRFSQICKVSPCDITKIQYKIAGTSIWETIEKEDYYGNAGNYNSARGFNSASYSQWNVDDSTAMPKQSWWEDEFFDLSVALRRQAGVEIRFVIIHGDVLYTDASLGWLLENIQLTAADYTMSLPIVEFISPFAKDAVYGTGPWEINARVESTTSASIITPYLVYTATEPGKQGITDSILMTHVSGNAYWKATIPQYALGTKVTYSITGRDATNNEATANSEYVIRFSCGAGDNPVADYSYTGGVQTVLLPPGMYQLECWGAAGGNAVSSIGGKGAYSMGTITLPTATTLYMYVGGIGTNGSQAYASQNPGGFNGGGNGGSAGSNGSGGGGGGATDIRVGTDDLYARVIVAGGGGGGGYSVNGRNGAAGGGFSGLNATGTGTNGNGGTQIGTGAASGGDYQGIIGGFGYGGSGYQGTAGVSGGGGAGSGWYGGSGGPTGTISSLTCGGGGGGSGWVYTASMYSVWSMAVATAISDQWLLDSIYHLADAVTIDGSEVFLSPTGVNETGHEGNGHVRITTISLFDGCIDNSVAISSIDMLDTVFVLPSLSIPIIATIRNMGSLDLDSVKVSYTINNSASVSTIWHFNPALSWEFKTQDTLGYYTPSTNGNDTILVFVSMPNGQMDAMTIDDTLTKIIYGSSDIQATFINSPAGIVYASGPYEIKASIKSISGALLPVNISLNVVSTYEGMSTNNVLPMQLTSGNVWETTISSNRFNSHVAYSINLTDIQGNNIQLSNNYEIKRLCEGTVNGCDTHSVALVSINSPEEIGMLAGNTIPVKVTIRNKGVADLDSCYLNWSLNGLQQPGTTVYKGQLPDDFIDTITIGSYIPVIDRKDTITAWVSMPNGRVDPIANDDTLRVFPLGCGTILSGSYVIGEGQPYASLTEVLDRIHNCGASGDIVLQLQGLHPYSIDMSDISDYMGGHALMITSYDNNADSAIIKVSGGVGITLNNSNNIVLKAITVDATEGTSNTYAIQFTGACTNVVIRDCKLLTNVTTSSPSIAPIYKASTTGVADSIFIINNLLDGGYNGFSFYGSPSADVYGTHVVFDSNIVSNQYQHACAPQHVDFISYSHNTILSRTTNTQGAWQGLRLYYCNGPVIGNRIIQRSNNITIPNGIYMQYYNQYPASQVHHRNLVGNNEIILYTISSNSAMRLISAKADLINNSIYVSGSGEAMGIEITNSVDNDLVIKNNNIVMKSTSAYPILFTEVGNLPMYNIDYNNLYAPTYVGYYGTAISSMSAWQQAIPTDRNSTRVLPDFMDVSTSLKLNNDVGLISPSIPPVIYDIHGVLRHSKTTMGCYAIPPMNGNAVLREIIGLTDGAIVGQTESMSVIVYNAGSTSLTSLNLEWSINGISQGRMNYPVSLQIGDFEIVTIGNVVYPSSNASIKVWINNLNNNTLTNESRQGDTVSTFINICQGSYGGQLTVGSTGMFPNIESVFNAFALCGISNDIILAMEPNTYQGIEIHYNTATFGNYKLTITSSSGNASDVIFNSTVRFTDANNIVLKNITINVENAGINGIEFVGTCSDIEINECTVRVSPTATYAINGISYTNTSNSGNQISNISIINNTISGGYCNISLAYIGGASGQGKNNRIDNNVLTNAYYCGIIVTNYGHLKSISNNSITTRASSTDQHGIYMYTNCNADTIAKNKILLQGISSSFSCYGIRLQSTNLTSHGATQPVFVANNEIRHLTATGYVYGILTRYTRADILHNSVYLKGASATVVAMYIDHTGSSYYLNIKNNIFYISTSSLGFPIYTETATYATQSYNTFLDYNDYYSTGSDIAYIAGSLIATLTDLRAFTGQDVNSANVLPDFIDANINLNLYQDAGLTCFSISGITHDIHGTLRYNLTTMGSYVVPSMNGNAAIKTIVGLSDGVVTAGQTDNVGVIVQNTGSIPLTSVNLEWSINGISKGSKNYPVSLQMGDVATIFLDSITYPANDVTIKIWINNLNNGNLIDEYPADDTISRIINICPTRYSGQLTVGTQGMFPDIESVFSALTMCGMVGDVTIELLPDIYQGCVISYDTAIFGNYKLTITSSTGNASDVIFNSTVQFNRANNVTLKNITVDVASQNVSGIVLIGTCSDVEISGCTILLNPTTTTATIRGIQYANTSNSGNQITNISILNNTINGGYYSIYLYFMGGSIGQGRNNRVDNNILTNAHSHGIYGYYHGHLRSVSNNIIITRASSVAQNGILFNYNICVDTLVNNKILLQGIATSGTSYGIYLNNTINAIAHGATQLAFVANNEVRRLAATNLTVGIAFNAARADVYHNSVYIKGTANAYACQIVVTNVNCNLNIQNNIFSVSTSGTGYPIYTTSANYVKQSYNTFLNYNDYYSTGTSIGFVSGAKTTLSDLLASTEQDINSVNIRPMYKDTSINLELNSIAGLSCPLLLSVPFDIQEQMRLSSTVMGCYVLPMNGNASLRAIVGLTDGVVSTGQTEDVKVIVQNTGLTTLTHINLEWSVDGISKGASTYQVSLQTGDVATITLGPVTYSSNNITSIKVWVNNLNNGNLLDEYQADDTISIIMNVCQGTYSGQLTVGTQGMFPNIVSLFDALIMCGMSGDVTAVMLPGIHAGGVIPYNTETFSNYKLMITSSTGNASDAIFNSTLRFTNADNIILKDITIDVASVSMSGIEFVGTCSDIEINGCTIVVDPDATIALNGISYANTSNSGNQISNISIINNTINGGYCSINLAFAGGVVGQGKNNRIDNNILTNAYSGGIVLSDYGYFKSISNNTITTRSADAEQYGLWLNFYFCVDTIVKNKILLQGTSSTRNCYGINLGMNTNTIAYGATQPAFVANNEIRYLAATGNVYGISVDRTRADILHNSVYISGTSTVRAMNIENTNLAYYLNIKNNIFSVATSGSGYPIYANTTSYAAQVHNTFLDYNNYYSTGSYVGYIGGVMSTVEILRLTTEQDANSLTMNPLYKNTNLSLEIDNLVTLDCPLLSSVPDDRRGQLRLSPTMMGAYEKTPEGLDLMLVDITPQYMEVVNNQQQQISIDIMNFGVVDIHSATFGWSLNGITQQTGISWTANPVLLSLETRNVTIGNFTATNTISVYEVKAWIENINGQADVANWNDTASISIQLTTLAEFVTPFVGNTINTLSFGVYVRIYEYTGAPVSTPQMYMSTIIDGCNLDSYDTISMQKENGIWVANVPKRYYNSKVIYEVHVSDVLGNIIVLKDSTYILFDGSGDEIAPIADYSFTGNMQRVTLPAGIYEIECWGADGGSNTHSGIVHSGGKGGYSKGMIQVNKPTELYLYVGQKGEEKTMLNPSKVQPAFNGGGSGGYSSDSRWTLGSTGGGASDIRIGGTDLTDRILVAGGGGGAAYGIHAFAPHSSGGNGGGFNGGRAAYPTIDGNTTEQIGYAASVGQGGTQTLGGARGTYNMSNNTDGSFGQGGQGGDGAAGGGGGGGGYYGGGGGCYGSPMSGGGGGGSSYIGGVANGITTQLSETDFVANPDISGNGFIRIITISKENNDAVYAGNDLAIFNLVSPMNNSNSICSPNYASLQIALANVGSDDYDFTRDSVMIGYRIINPRGIMYVGNISIDTGELLSGKLKTIELMSALPILAGKYEIKAWVTSAIDNFVCDDTLTTIYTSFKTALPIREDFSKGIPAEFVPISILGNCMWEYYSDSTSIIQPDSGTAMIRFNGASGSRTKLSTGQLDLFQAANPFIEFWYYHDTMASSSDYSYTKIKVRVNDAIEHDLGTVSLRESGRHGWAHYKYSLNKFITGNDCILIQFESVNKYEQTAQYIDYIHISSEEDAAVSEIIINPTPIVCSDGGSDILVVIEATRAQSIIFDNMTSLVLNINGTTYSVPLQGKILPGNSSDTIPVFSGFIFDKGTTAMKAYFDSPVDIVPANDTAKRDIIINPDFKIEIEKISTSNNPAEAGFKNNQHITIRNSGNMNLSNIGLILTVDTNTREYFRTTMIIDKSLAPNQTLDTTFTGSFLVPWSSEYDVTVYGYLLCDSANVNAIDSKREDVDIDDLYIIDITNPLENVPDTVGKLLEVSIEVGNKNIRTIYEEGDVKVWFLIKDTNGVEIQRIDGELPRIVGVDPVSYTFTEKYTVPALDTYYLIVYIEKKDNYNYNDTMMIVRKTISNVNISERVGVSFTMEQNIPNPANNNTIINYNIPQDGKILFNVYSVNGQLLYIEKKNVSFGEHQIELNLSDYASGIYFYTMEYKGQRIIKKMSIKR